MSLIPSHAKYSTSINLKDSPGFSKKSIAQINKCFPNFPTNYLTSQTNVWQFVIAWSRRSSQASRSKNKFCLLFRFLGRCLLSIIQSITSLFSPFLRRRKSTVLAAFFLFSFLLSGFPAFLTVLYLKSPRFCVFKINIFHFYSRNGLIFYSISVEEKHCGFEDQRNRGNTENHEARRHHAHIKVKYPQISKRE